MLQNGIASKTMLNKSDVNTYSVIPFIWNAWKRQTYRERKQISCGLGLEVGAGINYK